MGDDDLQLIDFSEEDDYLIDFPFRDSLEDFRLSVSFDNVNSQVQERSSHGPSESEEPRRPSFLRKSLAWDSAFFTSAGVLNPEELFMINKGFTKAKSSQPSSGTQKSVPPQKVSNRNPASSDRARFRLTTLEGDPFEIVKPDIDKLSKRSKVATNNGGLAGAQSNLLSSKKKNNSSNKTLKSVGASKIENISQVLKSMTKTRITHHQVIEENVSSVPKLISWRQTSDTAVEGSDNARMEIKTRKAGAPDSTTSKRSRWGDLSGLHKSTSFTSPTAEKNSKVHQSYESSSKHFSNSVRRKFDHRSTKLTKSPSSVHFSLSSTCSSSTSPASSLDGMFSKSLSLTPMTHQNITPASDFRSQNSVERKFSSQNATRSSTGTTPFSSGSKRKIKSSGLRMPSPKIGFFDEEPIFKGRMQDHFVGESPLSSENRFIKLQSYNLSPFSSENCLKVNKILSKEHDGRKVGASCSKLKPDKQIPKAILKNRMTNLERNRQKDEHGSFDDEKENVCSFEDQVNGLSRHLEVIDLDHDLREVKVQRFHELFKRPATPEHSAPCTRTPLAEKMLSK